jgi:hypothetical protein
MSPFPKSLLLAFVATAINVAAWAAAGSLYRGPYLQQATSNSVVVVWRTHGPTSPALRFGRTPDALTEQVAANAIKLRVSADVQAAAGLARLYQEPAAEVKDREADHDPSTAPNTYQFEARVSGLQPNSKYY